MRVRVSDHNSLEKECRSLLMAYVDSYSRLDSDQARLHPASLHLFQFWLMNLGGWLTLRPNAVVRFAAEHPTA